MKLADIVREELDWIEALIEQAPPEWAAHLDTIARNLRSALEPEEKEP